MPAQRAQNKLEVIRQSVEARLEAYIDQLGEDDLQTTAAIRYSLMAPGKRLRAIVTTLVGECLGADPDLCLVPGCAIEMAHAASLILDDLPCMDDAKLRRGLPANHIRFGDDIAILAAFGLLNHAHGILADCDGMPAAARVRLSSLLSRSVGLAGLIGGQEEDLRGAPMNGCADHVGGVHVRKTAALFVASAEAGAIVAEADEAKLAVVRDFANRLGMAFQTLDDFIDAYSNPGEAGKDTQQDTNRPNMVTTVGRDKALKELLVLVQQAVQALTPFGPDAKSLGQLAQSILDGARQVSRNGTSSFAAAP